LRKWSSLNTVLWIASLVLASVAGRNPAIGQEIDFQRDILPLLSDRCFLCHGPDEGSRQAGLRLDLKDGLLQQVAAGSLEDSTLWERINSDDDSERMPPPESRLALSPAEKELIRRWIEQGAKWNRHWSFEPLPETIPLPEVRNTSWPENPIDHFVLARLEATGASPNQEAPKWRWLRRVTLDLTGLPPDPKEIAEFEADTSPDARERVVDRLLASPHFGEHMAVSWLDAARYADSYGYQSDLLSPMWPWRDWLIRSINSNMPYDEFLTCQLAGDLLPEPTRDQRLATTFNRLHRMTNEGGSIALEWQTEYVADRVNTFGSAILGLTLECARCHDHKYDPVTQKDYYNLFSFFNNIDEWGMYNDSARVPTPSLLLPTPSEEKSIAEARTAWEAACLAVKQYRDQYSADFSGNPAVEKIDSNVVPVARFRFEEFEKDKSNWFPNDMDAKRPAENTGENRLVVGRHGKGVQFTGDDAVGFQLLQGSLNPWEPFAVSMWIRIPRGRENAAILHHTSGTDTGFHGTELVLTDGKLQFAMIRFWPGNAFAIRTREVLPVEEWLHIVIANEASGSASGLRVYVDGRSDTEIVRDHLTKRPDPRDSGFSLGARFRSPGFERGIIDEVSVYSRPLSAPEVRMVMNQSTSESASSFSGEQMVEHLLFNDTDYQALAVRRAEAFKVLLDYQTDITEIPVMQEYEPVRPAWVLARGQYDAPRDDSSLANRRTPAALPPVRDGAPVNRLGLAHWLTEPTHPLASRVAVNRLWANFFGEGLVSTMNDFGIQGRRPHHGELLDWLARDFVDNDWDVKRFCRQVVLSKTYRQDSAGDATAWSDDPQNERLARGPSRRLSAEMIRDVALTASGLLDRKMGGPPVSPYQPENLWREFNTMTNEYQQSTGTDLYRRSVYSVWKRTAPLPNMTVFDASGREVCSMSRPATSTPMQALVLFNDPQFVEAARVLAQNALKIHGEDTNATISEIFLRLAGRKPDERESTILASLFGQQFELFTGDQEGATKFLKVGDHPVDGEIDQVRLAAMAVVAQTILGSDATVWRR
jgi:Protein of unknown function (DUF1553)/Protein of unknown function (DUF1549)/Concanavalin A-like lectin/glucanases superfamily/Planctomycete cytochrome C